MSEEDKNINFLPDEIRAKREVVKDIIAKSIAYTEPTPVESLIDKEVKPSAIKLPPAAPWWRGLFRAKKKEEAVNKTEVVTDAPLPNVNLLSPEYAQEFRAESQWLIFILSIIAALLVIILSFAASYLYRIRATGNLQLIVDSNKELEQAMAAYAPEEKEDQILYRKAQAVKILLARHISFRKFLEKLEAATIPEVTYTSIAASREGAVILEALASDYTALARQLKIFEEDTPWVKEAVIASAGMTSDKQDKINGVSFDLTLSIDPAIFIRGE